MSLLSGIRFIPKDSRESSDENDNKNNKKRKHKKENKHKHSKKDKRKRLDNDKKSKKHYDYSDESSIDMDAIAKEELAKEEERSIPSRHNHDSFTSNNNDTLNKPEPKSFDINKFRSLISSLKSSHPDSNESYTVANEKEIINDSTSSKRSLSAVNEDHQPKYHESSDEINQSAPDLDSYDTSNKDSAAVTNMSVAAQLRNRLKNKQKLPIITTTSSNNNDSRNFDFRTDITAQKNLLLMKAQHQKQVDNGDASKNNAVKKKKSLRGNGSEAAILNGDKELDINELLRKEKSAAIGGNHYDEEDIDAVFRNNILRLGDRYQGTEMGGTGVYGTGDKAGKDEENEELDMRMFQKKEFSNAEALERRAKQVIREQQRMKQTVDNCYNCTTSRNFSKHLIISESDNVILRLAVDPYAVATNHCQIIPKQHIASVLNCDEDTITDINRYKSCLRRMFENQNKAVLFIETAVHFHSRPHTRIDVIPIDTGMEPEIEMRYKEAFLSCDEEWSQHRKIIPLTAKRPLSHAVPKHFEYLCAEWGDDPDSNNINEDDSYHLPSYSGVVHPVESGNTIDKEFCLDVVGGMLEMDPIQMRIKMHRGQFKRDMYQGVNNRDNDKVIGEAYQTNINTFKKNWSSYDWTAYL